MNLPENPTAIMASITTGNRLPLTLAHFPSRGQTAVQELYSTEYGPLFLKRTTERNHQDCQIDTASGTLAEREYWAFCLAQHLGIPCPELRLIDRDTTVQQWLNFPDARLFASREGPLELRPGNVFDCALFDWLTGQQDRHNANYLYNYRDKHIILIDSAHAFLRHEGSLPDYLEKFESANPQKLAIYRPTRILKNMRLLNNATLSSLAPVRDEHECRELLRRHQQIIKVRSIKDIIDLYRGKS